jgi:hypothetical protein
MIYQISEEDASNKVLQAFAFCASTKTE